MSRHTKTYVFSPFSVVRSTLITLSKQVRISLDLLEIIIVYTQGIHDLVNQLFLSTI